VIETAILSRKGVLKLAKGGGFRAHDHCIARLFKCLKGIIAKQVGVYPP
jgi:hypothetical protein